MVALSNRHLLRHIIAGDLPKAAMGEGEGEKEVIEAVATLRFAAKDTPGIYLIYLVDKDNEAVDVDLFREMLEDLDAYVKGEDKDLIQRIDQHHRG
jgi:hypothetical protein